MLKTKDIYSVKVLGTKGYEDDGSARHGDCIIIYNDQNKQMVVYDCGSEQHANTVLKFMNDNSILKTDVILSHNDSDHFNGIQKLIDKDKVDRIFTTLLLKYVDAILKKLDDKRRKPDSTKEHILELYDNIFKLKGNNLKDIYT